MKEYLNRISEYNHTQCKVENVSWKRPKGNPKKRPTENPKKCNLAGHVEQLTMNRLQVKRRR